MYILQTVNLLQIIFNETTN